MPSVTLLSRLSTYTPLKVKVLCGALDAYKAEYKVFRVDFAVTHSFWIVLCLSRITDLMLELSSVTSVPLFDYPLVDNQKELDFYLIDIALKLPVNLYQ